MRKFLIFILILGVIMLSSVAVAVTISANKKIEKVNHSKPIIRVIGKKKPVR